MGSKGARPPRHQYLVYVVPTMTSAPRARRHLGVVSASSRRHLGGVGRRYMAAIEAYEAALAYEPAESSAREALVAGRRQSSFALAIEAD